MRIAICVKQVPATDDVQIDRVTKRLRRENKVVEMNACDCYALELALRLRKKYGASIIAFTMGPPQARAVLKSCCALGVERGYLLNDTAFAGSDTYATAHILSCAIKVAEAENGPFDLILCGRQSSDGDTAQVGAELAEQLGIAQLTAVCDLPEIKETYIEAMIDCDSEQRLMQATLPVLLTVGRTPYELRLASIGGVIEANRNDTIKTLTRDMLPEIDAAMIGLDGSPTRTVDTFVPERSSGAQFIEGSTTEEAAKILAAMLRRGTV
jgi:electron transfer flavoprotein alpha/beta subunit